MTDPVRHRTAPRLESERLIVRHYTRADFEGHFAIVGDDEVMRQVGINGLSREEAWRRTAASVGMWDLLGFGGWTVVRKADDRIVGTVSLFNAWRALEPQCGDEPEMGWIFAREVHGQGIAREACDTVLAWADRELQPTPMWAIIAPENAASFKLAGRLGFERLGETIYNDEPIAVLKRPARG